VVISGKGGMGEGRRLQHVAGDKSRKALSRQMSTRQPPATERVLRFPGSSGCRDFSDVLHGTPPTLAAGEADAPLDVPGSRSSKPSKGAAPLTHAQLAPHPRAAWSAPPTGRRGLDA
jgi:hypothetical protein